jgi:hypothetical protein
MKNKTIPQHRNIQNLIEEQNEAKWISITHIYIHDHSLTWFAAVTEEKQINYHNRYENTEKSV